MSIQPKVIALGFFDGVHLGHGALLRRAVEEGGDVPEELGDVLFAAVKVGRFCACDPEDAVNGTCEKFIRRFGAMESAARQAGRSLDELSREELLSLWSAQKTGQTEGAVKTETTIGKEELS